MKCTSMFYTSVCKKCMRRSLQKVDIDNVECMHSVGSSMQTDLLEALG